MLHTHRSSHSYGCKLQSSFLGAMSIFAVSRFLFFIGCILLLCETTTDDIDHRMYFYQVSTRKILELIKLFVQKQGISASYLKCVTIH